MNVARSPWQTPLTVGGALFVLLLVVAPGARAVYLNGASLWTQREWTFLTSPAMYIWAGVSALAVILPLTAVMHILPLMRAEDAVPRVMAAFVGSQVVMAVVSALLLHAAGWASYPLLKDGQLRFLPLFPWPDWKFWGEYLRL
ncbi:MAG: hypothetical protein JST93_19875 [Acidobacteria bacterium]|nr:hypothetical protein [Acidobacteriota bacterium]